MVVTCEEPFERYIGEEVQKRQVDYALHRSRTGYQLSGVPRTRMREVTHELRRKAAYVFATSLPEDFYESFGECWEEFVNAMDV
jgi:hypothetical protein